MPTPVTHNKMKKKATKGTIPWLLYNNVSGRGINILSPVHALQHVEERKSHQNRALLVLFLSSHVEATKGVRLERKMRTAKYWFPSPPWKVSLITKFLLFLCISCKQRWSSQHMWHIWISEQRETNGGAGNRNKASTPALPPIKYLSFSINWLFLNTLPLLCTHTHAHTHTSHHLPADVLIAVEIRLNQHNREKELSGCCLDRARGCTADPPPALHPTKNTPRSLKRKRGGLCQMCSRIWASAAPQSDHWAATLRGSWWGDGLRAGHFVFAYSNFQGNHFFTQVSRTFARVCLYTTSVTTAWQLQDKC